MDRFNTVAMQIQDLDTTLEFHSVKRGLSAGPFVDSMAINSPRSMVEFRERERENNGVHQYRRSPKDKESRSSNRECVTPY